jgi:hypothetical protein
MIGPEGIGLKGQHLEPSTFFVFRFQIKLMKQNNLEKMPVSYRFQIHKNFCSKFKV